MVTLTKFAVNVHLQNNLCLQTSFPPFLTNFQNYQTKYIRRGIFLHLCLNYKCHECKSILILN